MTPFMTQRLSWILVLAGAGTGCAQGGPGDPGDLESTLQDVVYNGAANQFAGGFHPSNAPDGGFGGGNCVNATFFARPTSNGAPTVYATLKAAGYNDCELFGITWLNPTEQANQPLNFHTATKAAMI